MPTKKGKTAKASKITKQKKSARKRKETAPLVPPEAQRDEELRPVKTKSMTSLAGEALRTGVAPYRKPDTPSEIPGEDKKMTVGDVDVDPLRNEYSGEEVPGTDMPTPDQNNVDDIGRAYGISEEDSGELVTSNEILSRRDKNREELKAPKKPRKR